ncbi:GNAT family N-acetyltransferase [Candidatus Poribacteria bacterium]|nr:GNAT family N-acetyltransferase [Candidatus Poribacteria bacterium]
MNVKVIRDSDSFLFLKEEWNRLLDASESKSVYLTWEWLWNWWAVFGEGKELFLLCLFQGDDLVGLLPLFKSTRTFLKMFRLKKLEYLGTGEKEDDEVCSNFLEPILHPEYAEVACGVISEAMMDQFGGEWDVIHLKNMDSESLTRQRLAEKFSERSCRVRSDVMFRNGVTRFDGGWEPYFQSLGQRTRKKLKREKRLLESTSGFQYVFLRDETEFQWMFREIVRMNVKRWGRSSAMASEKFKKFQERAGRELFAKEMLKLSVMRADGRVVAGNLDYSYKDVVYGYQTAFDPEYKPNVGVGFLSMVYCLENAAKEGFRVYDWYRVAPGEYKEHLLTAVRDILGLTIYRHSLASCCDPIEKLLPRN